MIYIELFHGRKPGEQLQDWGMPGPVFASSGFFHITYACEIKFGEDGSDILTIVGGKDDTISDCVYYDGVFYGDWSVFSEEVFARSSNLRSRLTAFQMEKARVTLSSLTAGENRSLSTRFFFFAASIRRWLTPWL